MRCTVVNLRKESYDIYIGRGSEWGNPFIIGRDGNRQEVVDKYIKWLESNNFLLDRLITLKGKRLGCFCKPQACHGDYLSKKVNFLYGD